MAQRRGVRGAWMVLAGLVLLAGGAAAVGGTPVEELAKRLPDGVLGFVATSGGAALQGDFEKTALGRIWNDPGVQTFYGAIQTELLAKAAQQTGDPNAVRTVGLVTQYARMVLGRPLLVGLAQVPADKGPPVGVFAIVDAGDQRAELAAAVSKLEAMAGPDRFRDAAIGSLQMRTLKDQGHFPLQWGWAGNHLVLAANDGQGTLLKYTAAPRAAVPPYLGKVPAAGDALVFYYDYQKFAQLFGALLRETAGPGQKDVLTPVLKGLGLDEARIVARVGFAGSDVVARALFEVPTPPTGLLAAYRPIDLAWFAAVDVRAVTATAVNCDIASLYDTIMNILKTVSPDEGYLEIRRAIVDFESDAKLRIREGLLASLAGPALFYSLPAGPIVEAPRGGFVALARLKDAALFEKSLSALEAFVGAKAKGSLQIGTRSREDGRTVHVWGIPALAMLNIMPAWSVAGDHVVIGSSSELCDLGVKQLAAKGADGKSLLDAAGYRKVAADLPPHLISLTYTDSQAQLNQTLMQLQQFWPLATMLAMQAQVKLPVMLPSLTDLARELGPSCSYRYFDSQGLHLSYRGPGIEASQMTFAGAALGAGIALPALAKARDQARTAVDMGNLKGIGLGLIQYASDHQGDWPADLEQAKSYFASPRILQSPRKPKDFEGPSYVYVAGQAKNPDTRNVVVYENPAFCTDKIQVLFIDGHVESMTPETFREALKTTCERLGREMPEIRFQGETGAKPRAPRPPGSAGPAQVL